jgi:uncharacterized protein (UPF0332 family)
MGKEEVLLLVARASGCLDEAQVLYDAHLYIGSINRAYYSIFNALQAALQSKDIMVKTHQGAHVQFYQHFIKTGIFGEGIKVIPQKVEDMRLKGDYEPDHQLYEEDARTAILLAKQFYDAIKSYVDAKN